MPGDAYGGAELLTWDTEFFGCRIAKVRSTRLDEAAASSIDAWCQQHGIECLYLLADLDDPTTLEVASGHGYTMVDVRMTLHLDAPFHAATGNEDGSWTRMVADPDRDRLRDIAAGSFADSRFYFDRGFPKARCDALYDTWLSRDVDAAFDDPKRHAVVVAETDGQVAGFVTCELVGSTVDASQPAAGTIGLVGVHRDARGRGVGRAVLDGALSWLDERGAATVSVVTQGRNVGAQRLYQQRGFRTDSVQAWFHKWFK